MLIYMPVINVIILTALFTPMAFWAARKLAKMGSFFDDRK